MADKNKHSRKAAGLDPELQAKALNRLKRIEGQVRGVQKMVEEGRYCADVLEQVSSIQEALVGVSKTLMKNHLRHCVAGAAAAGDGAKADQMYDELIEILGRHWR